MIVNQKFLYRYDGYEEYALRTPNKYFIVKETPCGWWLESNWPDVKGRWVSKTGRKRFAYPTREGAKENYIARKWRQIQHCRAAINNAEEGLRIMGVKVHTGRRRSILDLKVEEVI
jgi:hypothetical protein